MPVGEVDRGARGRAAFHHARSPRQGSERLAACRFATRRPVYLRRARAGGEANLLPRPSERPCTQRARTWYADLPCEQEPSGPGRTSPESTTPIVRRRRLCESLPSCPAGRREERASGSGQATSAEARTQRSLCGGDAPLGGAADTSKSAPYECSLPTPKGVKESTSCDPCDFVSR